MLFVFNPSRLSRSITRKEWKEIWRWKRVTEKRLVEELERQRQNFIAFHTTMPSYMKKDIMEQMIYPPILIYPAPKDNQSIDLRPGAINYTD